MIKKLKKIDGLGLFSKYQWDSDIPDFRRYNLIFGWNGSGKTTLSKLFSCLEIGFEPDFPNLKYDIELDAGSCTQDIPLNQKVRVFNQDYIQNNVHLLSGKANPIFILGEENKQIADQIKIDEKILEKMVQQKNLKEDEKRKKVKEKGNQFTTIAKVIGANLAGSSTRNYRKPQAENDFSSLKDKKFLTEEEVTTQKVIIGQEQKEKINRITFENQFDLTNLFDEVSNICKETVEINVISRLTENQDISEWVEKGLNFGAYIQK